MITTAIGVSDKIEVDDALEEVITTCRNKLGTAKPQAGILFTSLMQADFAAILSRVNAAFPGIDLVGCTTDGEIVPGHGFIEDSIALLLLASDTVEFAASIAEGLSLSAEDAFARAYETCRGKLQGEPVFGLTFPDGLSTIAISLDKAIQQACGKTFPMFGGTAGDHSLLTGTYQFFGNRVYQDAAPLLLAAGNVVIESVIKIGLEPIGSFHQVDHCQDNMLYRIDDTRAADLYEEIIGTNAHKKQTICQFSLAIYEEGEEGFYLRNPLQVNKQDGSVTFVGRFPENFKIRFITVSREDILESANLANRYLLHDEKGRKPELILVFSCMSRRHSLGLQTVRELALLLDEGSAIPFFGFYCYGELGPVAIGQPCRFHSDTYVALSIRSIE